MSSLKVRMTEIIQEQPEDATYEEITRELAFERMVEHRLADSRTGRVISNEEMACSRNSLAQVTTFSCSWVSQIKTPKDFISKCAEYEFYRGF